MFALRLLARVPAEKRQEFLDSLRSLTASESSGLCRRMLFEEVDDRTLHCWMGDCESEEELQAFTQSDVFRALRGAIRSSALIRIRTTTTAGGSSVSAISGRALPLPTSSSRPLRSFRRAKSLRNGT